MRIFLWYQRPPREQWVLKAVYETADRVVIVRTWFPEYNRSVAPPPIVTIPAAIACARIARAAARGGAARYQVEMRNS